MSTEATIDTIVNETTSAATALAAWLIIVMIVIPAVVLVCCCTIIIVSWITIRKRERAWKQREANNVSNTSFTVNNTSTQQIIQTNQPTVADNSQAKPNQA